MTANEIRDSFKQFFESKGHTIGHKFRNIEYQFICTEICNMLCCQLSIFINMSEQ